MKTFIATFAAALALSMALTSNAQDDDLGAKYAGKYFPQPETNSYSCTPSASCCCAKSQDVTITDVSATSVKTNFVLEGDACGSNVDQTWTLTAASGGAVGTKSLSNGQTLYLAFATGENNGESVRAATVQTDLKQDCASAFADREFSASPVAQVAWFMPLVLLFLITLTMA